MTGNKFLLFLCLCASPAYAQMPNAGDSGPNTTLPNAVPAPSVPSTSDTDTSSFSVIPTATAKNPPKVVIGFSHTSGPTDHLHLTAPRITYGGELTLDADQADADQATQQYDLRGHVRMHEADTTLRAEEVTFGGSDQSASATDALLARGYFTIRAPKMVGTPEQIIAYNSDFTTVPNGGRADYYLHAQTITLDALHHRGTLRNATLYLFGTRLITIPRLSFGLGGGGSGSQHPIIIPTVGISSRYGTYIAFGKDSVIGRDPIQYRILLPTQQSVQAIVTSQQTLYTPRRHPLIGEAVSTNPPTLLDRIRAAATVPVGALPEGDPLRFQDFLPDPDPIQLFNAPSHGGLYLGEDLSVHVAASGRLRNDLYVSRLPELALSGDIPLTHVPSAPTPGDPQSFRAALRHVVLYAQAQETVGAYREQLSAEPYNTFARRVRSQGGLTTRPLLIAPNTVLLPSVLISSSSYSGSKSAYRYDQINVAVNHYFSDLTAVGIQFLASTTSGDSPFDFDVLDTTRELDVRFQTGNSRLIAASRIRYDLVLGGVID
ncbi:MAG: hypothetical protein ACRYFS_15885 [Janthinobacterium lividum]